MIINYKKLASTPLRKHALDILGVGVASALPKNVFPKSLHFRKNKLLINNDKHDLSTGRLYVIGGGKASGGMAQELEKIIPKEKIHFGLVNSIKPSKTQSITILQAGHPIPNKEGVRGVKKMLEQANKVSKKDTVISLISGGGSSLLTYPVQGVTLNDVRKLTSILLKSGAATYETQYIRKHISQIKGGQLARIFQPAKIISLVISDLINPRDVVASGPTEADESTFEQAFKVLKKYNLVDEVPKSVIKYLEKGIVGEISETPKKGDKFFNNVYNYTLADYKVALLAMKKRAKQLGYKTWVIQRPLLGSVTCAVEEIIEVINSRLTKYSGSFALIYASDMTINVRGKGRGGRNQEFTARLIPSLERHNNYITASIGSDGVDFIKGIGGAFVDDKSVKLMKKLNLEFLSYLKQNNTYCLHNKLETLMRMRPTGTNIGDIHVFLHRGR